MLKILDRFTPRKQKYVREINFWEINFLKVQGMRE